MSERRYRFAPLEERALIGPLRSGQVVVVGAAAAVGICAIFATQSIVAVLVAVVLVAGAAGAVAFPINGRTAADWAPIFVSFKLRKRRGGYRSTAPASGVRLGADEPYEVSLPPELAGLDLLSVPYGGDEIGVMCDRREITYTAAIAVRAGAFALRDVADQERALEGWGGVLASCAREGSPLRRLQWHERTLPGQGDELASYLQEKRDRSVPFNSSVVSSYIELIEAAAPVTQEHDVLICLQIDPRRANREMKRMGGGDDAACKVLLREAENLARSLSKADITVFGLLQPRQYAEVIRDAFDPFGHQGRARSTLGEPEREGVEPSLMGPMAAEDSWTYYRSDSAFHSTYWVSSWPRIDVGPTFLAPLLMQSVTVRTLSVTIEPVPFAQAMRKAEMAQTKEIAGEIERQRQGFLTTAGHRRQQQAVAHREEELADGNAEMIFAKFITVSDRSVEALERSNSDTEHAAQLARLELQPMYGEQDAGFANTLPLCRGLR
ncbi:MAG: hypothetical protein JSU06_16475 [Actinobacteria bacterium]|nr:hypothetical protein [Actinomycetota bacterium]